LVRHNPKLTRTAGLAVTFLKQALITKVDCFDLCEHAPVMVVYPDGVWYGEVDERGAREIAERHLGAGGTAARPRVLRDMREDGKREV
jgi:(2Fe-2S) ferredoxin